MISKDNGGPAFPRPHSQRYQDDQFHAQSGMTLRDYFAAKAMQGIMASNADYQSHEDIAFDSYRMADTMLLERTND